MQNGCSDFQIPSFSKPEAYNFDNKTTTFEFYQELSEISEDIERCRARNLR